MSAQSIARWNAIPMERPEVGHDQNTLKRSRDAMDEDDSDDNVSIVSRTPSPPPEGEHMDVDKYDEYNRGVEREVITVDTKISSSNKGFAMLAKLGWKEGQPLGLSADGRVEPIPFVMKNDFTGLGKSTQDVRMIESTVSQRRELDSERQIKETEDQRKAREETVAKRHAVQSEISSVLRPFYCELCDKQFRNVAQYDEHTNSYAHHHKARLRDMQAAQRATFAADADKRKEKEKKREEKELRKIAKAAGIKMPKQPATSVAVPAESSVASQDNGQGAVRKGGWATVDSSPSVSAAHTSDPGYATRSPSGIGAGQGGGWASTSHPSAHIDSGSAPAPAFRTGGWTTMDSSSSGPTPNAPPPPTPSAAPPPPEPSTRGGWSSVSTPAPPANASGSSWSSVVQPVSAAPERVAQSDIDGVLMTQPPNTPRRPPAAKPTEQRQEAARSGWQQFKTGGPRRR